MKIAGIETFAVSLPVRRPHSWAGNFSPPGRGYVVLKLTLEDGTVGWGEAQVLKDWGGEYGARSGESHETARVVIADLLAPIVIGEDVRRIEIVNAKMDKLVRGYPYAKAAIDAARSFNNPNPATRITSDAPPMRPMEPRRVISSMTAMGDTSARAIRSPWMASAMSRYWASKSSMRTVAKTMPACSGFWRTPPMTVAWAISRFCSVIIIGLSPF